MTKRRAPDRSEPEAASGARGRDTQASDGRTVADGGTQAEVGYVSTALENRTYPDVDEVLDTSAVLNVLPEPFYVLDAEHTVIAWSDGLEGLLGLSREAMLGWDDLFGRDENGDLIETLSNKVVESPRNAEQYDHVTRVENEYASGPLYESELWLTNDNDERRYIRFQAVPVFQNGSLAAVVQMCRDETERQRQQEATEALVEELIETLGDFSIGNFDARATFDRTDYVEDHLLRALEQVNEMGEQVGTLVASLTDQTESLSETADANTDAATEIDELVDKQTTALSEAVRELDEFSARMEEISANSDEVATAASAARETAESGLEAGQQAVESAEQLDETSETLQDRVDALGEEIDRVVEVVEVIQSIADETNMLALNASIEAARVGDGKGSGFGVVADEIKSLAEETSDNADQISEQVEGLQIQAGETVETIERVHDEIDMVVEQIEAGLESFEDIETRVSEASRGIDEIAAANDQQAQAVDQLNAMLEDIESLAKDARSSTEQIVDRADEQRAAVGTLVDDVEQLTGGQPPE